MASDVINIEKTAVDKRTTLSLEALEIIELIALIGYLYFVLTGRFALSLIAPKTLLFEASLAIFLVIFVIGMVNLLYRWTLPLHEGGAGTMASSFLSFVIKAVFSTRIFLMLEALVVQGFLQSRIFKQSILRWVMHMTLAWGCLIFLVLYILDIREIIEKVPFGHLITTAIDLGILLVIAITVIGLAIAVVRNLTVQPALAGIAIIAAAILGYFSLTDFASVYGAGLFVYEKVLYNLAAVLVFIGLTIVFIRRRSKEVKPLTDFSLDIPGIFVVTVLSATGFAGFYIHNISTLASEVILHIHFITSFAVFAYLPFSKFLHIPAAKFSYILNAGGHH